jgi:hypothetical protein
MHMHGETYAMQQIQRKRARGKRMADSRWAAVRRRQQAVEEMIMRDPLRAAQALAVVRTIRQRVIVIGADQVARELVRWSTTTARQWARMKRAAGL